MAPPTTTTATATPFRIRDAVPSPANADAAFITAAFDSCIPHLSKIGSAAQWGTEPISRREGFAAQLLQAIADAESYRLSTTTALSTSSASTPTIEGDGPKQQQEEVPEARVVIIEAPTPITTNPNPIANDNERGYIPIGASILRGGAFFPEYIQNEPQLEKVVEEAKRKRNHIYLHTLVTEFREETQEIRKGAGAALVRDARVWAGSLGGKKWLFVDCFGGNDGRLAR